MSEETKKLKVQLYTTSTCAICQLVKNYFNENNIEFEEVDLTFDRDAGMKFFKKTGLMSVPATLVDDKFLLIGFNEKNYDQFFKEGKRPEDKHPQQRGADD